MLKRKRNRIKFGPTMATKIAPRWMHRLYAFLFGYFWKPCPNCGKMFGGHEGRGGTLWTEGDDYSRTGAILCSDCPGSLFSPGYTGYKSSTDFQTR